MLALASGFYAPNVVGFYLPKGGYNPVGLRKARTALAFAAARACVKATATRRSLICKAHHGAPAAQSWTVGANAESDK